MLPKRKDIVLTEFVVEVYPTRSPNKGADPAASVT
jgi:hypothetical protein